MSVLRDISLSCPHLWLNGLLVIVYLQTFLLHGMNYPRRSLTSTFPSCVVSLQLRPSSSSI